MARKPTKPSAKKPRKYEIYGRNRFTGGYILKPSSKGATRTLAQIRAAIKKVREENARRADDVKPENP